MLRTVLSVSIPHQKKQLKLDHTALIYAIFTFMHLHTRHVDFHSAIYDFCVINRAISSDDALPIYFNVGKNHAVVVARDLPYYTSHYWRRKYPQSPQHYFI